MSSRPRPEVPPERQQLRQIQFGAIRVDYTLQRSSRRTRLGLVIRPGAGLIAQAPQRVTLREIESALQAKSAWVLRHLQTLQQRAAQQAEQRITWANSASLPWLGQPLRLEILQTPARQPVLIEATAEQPARLLIGRLSTVTLSEEDAAQTLRARVERWWKVQALTWFTARCAHFAPLLGVQPERITLSSATTRWGSASRRGGGPGSIRLSWRLMFFRPELIDYVVVHELAHLHEMNHGPAFWAWVEKVLPDWRHRQAELRRQPVPDWD